MFKFGKFLLSFVGSFFLKFVAFSAEFLKLTLEHLVLAQLAADATIVEIDLDRWLEADEVERFCFRLVATCILEHHLLFARDHPCLAILESFLERSADHAVESRNVGNETLAIRRVEDKHWGRSIWILYQSLIVRVLCRMSLVGKVFKVLMFESDVFGKTCSFDVLFCHFKSHL